MPDYTVTLGQKFADAIEAIYGGTANDHVQAWWVEVKAAKKAQARDELAGMKELSEAYFNANATVQADVDALLGI